MRLANGKKTSWSSTRRSPTQGEAFGRVGQGEGLLGDVAEPAQVLVFAAPLREITGMIRRRRSSRRTAFESCALSPRTDSGRHLGRPGRPASGGMPSTGARVPVMSLTLAAVVVTCSGVLCPSQIRWCLLPVFRRSTGDGPVAAPSFVARTWELSMRAGPAEFAGRVQLGEQQPVAGQGSGLLRAILPSPAGLFQAEPSFGGRSRQATSLNRHTEFPANRVCPETGLGPGDRETAQVRAAAAV